jgi:uncharacterized heparinase superfamily protein
MPGIISHICHSAAQMTYSSMLYNWSLRGAVPERMVVRPVDPWAGDAEAGRILCEGGVPDGYRGNALHGFMWLRDLRAFAQQEKASAAQARRQARFMIESWIDMNGRWSTGAWDVDVTGDRIAMWISGYEFFAHYAGMDLDHTADDEDEDFQDEFFDSLSRQACHLSRVIARDGEPLALDGVVGVGALRGLKGLLYAGLAFEGREAWVAQALSALRVQMDAQICADGSHKSRSPAELLEALQVLLDVRVALNAGGYPLPQGFLLTLEKMAAALQFFRYSDRGLAVFNGTQEGDLARLDAVLAQSGVRGKSAKSLPHSGFEKMTVGRTSVMFDCGRTPHYPYDAHAHAAPLSFEMSYGRERVFVNCGTHSSSCHVGQQWSDMLRATAAHNCLIMNDRNACEIADNGHYARAVQKAACNREELNGAVLVEASHDGYERLNGFTHRRRVYLSDDGHDVRGEECLSAQAMPAAAIDVAVRFHLHPRAMVSLIRGGEEALIRLHGGAGWRFHFSGGRLALEDSVYMGSHNEARKTKQLAIYGQITDKKHKIIWALQKEG